MVVMLIAAQLLCLEVASGRPTSTVLQPATLPTPVRAIKFDPWQSAAQRGTQLAPLAPVLLREWVARGFNTVFLIVQPRGRTGDPRSAKACCCNSSTFGGDLLRALLDAAAQHNVTVVPGVWGLRNFPVGEAHPDWRAVNENGTAPFDNEDEGGDLCAASPYAETYLLPLVRQLRRSYGVRSFFLMEFWQPWSLDFPERTSYSPFMRKSFVGGGPQDREPLRMAVRANVTLHDAWHMHQMEQQWRILVSVDEALRDGVVGGDACVIWHNVDGIDAVDDTTHTARTAWNFLRDQPSTGAFGAPVIDFVGNMLLYLLRTIFMAHVHDIYNTYLLCIVRNRYADLMCFDRLCPSATPNDLPLTAPVLLEPAARRQRYLTEQLSMMPVGARVQVLTETIGRSIVPARPTASDDVVEIFLADFVSAGQHSAGFIYEQDAWAIEPGEFDVWGGLAAWMQDMYPLLFAAATAGDNVIEGLHVDNATLTAHRVLHAPPSVLGGTLQAVLVLANFASNRSSVWTVPTSNGTVLLDLRKGVAFHGPYVRVLPQTVAVVGF